MKNTFNFGKYAICSNRKINEVTVEVELKEENGKQVFTACGNVWNIRKTDIVMGGQCLDDIAKYVKNPLFVAIHKLWKKYHLNDMHAGTVEQEEAVEAWKAEGNRYDYTKVCEYLKSIGLYEVELDGKPYKYGHAWLYRAIPDEDLALIKKIILEGKI